MIRKSIYILVFGLLFAATAANACDGPKATKASKLKKASATCTKSSCMKDGKCTMTAAQMKAGACDMSAAKTDACPMKASGVHATCGMKGASAAAAGDHSCCKAKAANSDKS
jgi:hypothetical protein